MRFLLSLAMLIPLFNCSNQPSLYDEQAQRTRLLESMLHQEQGLPGTAYHSSARTTEIREANPTSISWFATSWDWQAVDFSKYRGGKVEAIYQQMKHHESHWKAAGFQLMAADFYTNSDHYRMNKPVGWYRKHVIKYDRLEQSGVHQSPIDQTARELVCKRVYLNRTQAPGILFITYRYVATSKILHIEFAYSALPGQLDEFETYQFNEKLIFE